MFRRLGFVFFAATLLVGVCATQLPVSAEEPSGNEATGASVQTPRFVAYYFHGNMRCATCRKLEAYSEEAITKGFAEDLPWRGGPSTPTSHRTSTSCRTSSS